MYFVEHSLSVFVVVFFAAHKRKEQIREDVDTGGGVVGQEVGVRVDVEGDVFDGGGDASTADGGGMFGDYDEFGQRNDVIVAWLGTGEVATAFGVV